MAKTTTQLDSNSRWTLFQFGANLSVFSKNFATCKPRRFQPVFWELLSSNTGIGLEGLQTLLSVSKLAPSTTVIQNLATNVRAVRGAHRTPKRNPYYKNL
jgi:hypothetical protein